jgi:serine/threonine protein kinase
MPLKSGARLGPYDILAPLGAGGFGEVYKARDTRLDRTVAMNIIPSADPELKARFECEAKAIAALTHPHICTLYDVGHQDGTDSHRLACGEGPRYSLLRPPPFEDVIVGLATQAVS